MTLFAYGTLMDPAVWSRVAREPAKSQRGVLTDYEARRLRGVTFPGLVEAAGARVPGLLYFDVSDAAMERLDEYEDDFYIRIEVTVEAEDGTRVPAQVYLMHPDHREVVLDDIWHPPGVRDFSHT